MDRRRFLAFAPIAGLAGLAAGACRAAGGDPGAGGPGSPETWSSSLCTLCPGGCGTRVRLAEGSPVALEGDPGHPVNRGILCDLGATGLAAPRGTPRIPAPLRREGLRGEGRWGTVTWDEALASLRSALRQAVDPGAIRFLTGRIRGHRAVAVDRFLSAWSAPPAEIVEPFHDEPVREACERTLGIRELPACDLPRTRTLLTIGSPLTTAGPSPLWFRRLLAGRRSTPAADGFQHVHVEPRRSAAAEIADQWIAARPGTESALLLAVAGLLISRGLQDRAYLAARSSGFSPADWSRISPEEASEQTGVAAGTIVQLAMRLGRSRPSAILAGGIATAQSNGLDTALAAAAVNALLGAWETPGGLYFPASALARESPVAKAGLIPARPTRLAGPDPATGLSPGMARILFIAGSDPASELPGMRRALEDPGRLPLVVALASHPDATTALADWVLPMSRDVECWQSDLAEGGPPEPGVTLLPPAAEPPAWARSLPEVLRELLPQPGALPTESESIAAIAGSIRETWDSREGGSPLTTGARFAFPERGLLYSPPRFEKYPAEAPLVLLPRAELADRIQPGPRGPLPAPRLEIHPLDAEALRIPDGSRVEISSEYGRAEAVARYSTGLLPGAVSLQALRTAGWAELLAPLPSPAGGICWGATRVAVRRARPRRPGV